MSALLDGVADSLPLAGGMTLLPTIKQRLAAPAALVDLSKIPQLFGITVTGDALTIGAMTRHIDVAESADVRGKVPMLAGLAAGIGDPAVRNRGTIGGSVANNDPSADYPAAVLALDAIVVTDRREIAADAFFKGLFTTALEPDEIITAVRFPIPSAGGYAKFKSPASRYALVGVCVARQAGKVRVAVTGAGPGVHAGRDRRHQGEFGKSQFRYSRGCGIPRTSRDRDGKEGRSGRPSDVVRLP
jgi:carbon-monoxide dehydrogenase medium subunit